MKKFEIKGTDDGKWLVSYNEVPKFTCLFENKRFSYQRTITGLTYPTGNPKEVQVLQKMEQWPKKFYKGQL